MMLILLSLIGPCFQDNATKQKAISELEVFCSKLIEANPPGKIAATFYERVRKLETTELVKLKSHNSDSLALQAAMEEARRSAVSGISHRERVADASALHRLIGFVEGRLRVSAPPAWSSGLRNAGQQFTGRDSPVALASFPAVDSYKCHILPYPEGRNLGRPELSLLDNYSILQVNRSTITFRGNGKLVITKELIDLLDQSGDSEQLSVAEISGRIYAAMPTGYGYRSKLTCLDSKTSKVAWQSSLLSIDCNSAIAIQGPRPGEIIEITQHNHTVMVFGTCGVHSFIEAFDIESGKPRFRCSTYYCWQSE